MRTLYGNNSSVPWAGPPDIRLRVDDRPFGYEVLSMPSSVASLISILIVLSFARWDTSIQTGSQTLVREVRSVDSALPHFLLRQLPSWPRRGLGSSWLHTRSHLPSSCPHISSVSSQTSFYLHPSAGFPKHRPHRHYHKQHQTTKQAQSNPLAQDAIDIARCGESQEGKNKRQKTKDAIVCRRLALTFVLSLLFFLSSLFLFFYSLQSDNMLSLLVPHAVLF